MKNKLPDLRNHLFETIEMLKDPESTMTIEKAKAIADVSQVIINSAKIEVDFIKATGITEKTTDFIPVEDSREKFNSLKAVNSK